MTDYLPHDIDAADDARLQELQMEMRGQGYAIWWRLLELLWKNEGRLPYKPALLAYNIRWCTAEEVERVITGFDLFVVQDGQFWSDGLLRRIETRNAKGEKGRKNANARWHPEDADAAAMQPQCDGNATAMQPQCDGNANITTLHNNKQHYADSSAPAHTREAETATKAKIFDLFFFKNFKNPGYEVDRFWNYYAASGWLLAEGKPVRDKVALAEGWKPEDNKPRLNQYCLACLQTIHARIEKVTGKRPPKLLTSIVGITKDPDSHTYTVVFNDRPTAQEVANFVKMEGAMGDGDTTVFVQYAKKQPTPNPLP